MKQSSIAHNNATQENSKEVSKLPNIYISRKNHGTHHRLSLIYMWNFLQIKHTSNFDSAV